MSFWTGFIQIRMLIGIFKAHQVHLPLSRLAICLVIRPNVNKNPLEFFMVIFGIKTTKKLLHENSFIAIFDYELSITFDE